MSEVLNMRHTLAASGQTHYVGNDVIEACDPPDDAQSAAHIMVSERHGKFALVDMTACLLSQKATLTARVAELERSQDDPSADGTENAHPAYWRGHEDARRAAALLTKGAT